MSGEGTRTVAANTAWLFAERLIGRLITFLLMVVLARALGTVNFGKLNYANSFAALFVILADMGIGTLITRDMAANRDAAADYFGKSVVLMTPLVAVAAVVMTAAALFADVPTDTFYLIFLFGGYHLLKNVAAVYATVFKAFERMRYAAIVQVVERVLLLGFCLLAIRSSSIVIGVGLAYLLTAALFLLLTVGLVHLRFFVPRYRFRPEHLRYVVTQGFPLAVVAVVSLFYFNIDMIMLGELRGEASVGVYGAAYRLFFTVATLFSPLLTALFPAMARLHEDANTDRLASAYGSAVKLFLGLGIPIGVGGAMLSAGIVDFVYGAEFAAAAPVFRWFSFIILVGYLNSVNCYLLTAVKRQGIVAKAIGLTALLNLVLNALLIPAYGEFGAVWATMVSEVLLMGITFASIPTPLRQFPAAATGKSLVVVAGMAAVVYYVQSLGARLLLTVALGAAVYILGLLVVRYLDDAEIDRLKHAVGKRNRP